MAGLAAATAVMAVLVGAGALRPGAHRAVGPIDPATPGRSGIERFVDRSVDRIVRRGRRRRGIDPMAVAAWCDDLARRLRAGETLRAAIVDTTPADVVVAEAIDTVRLALVRGASIEDAVGHVALDGRGAGHLQLATAVIGVSARFGGAEASALERVAAALRLRAADRQERAAHAAQARMSAHVLTVVPFVVLGALASLDPSVRTALGSPVGLGCVATGGLLNLGGWVWMQRIVGGAP